MCLDGERNDQMAFHALADYQNHVIGWLQWEQSSLGDGAVVRFPRIWMSSGECRLSSFDCGLTRFQFRPLVRFITNFSSKKKGTYLFRKAASLASLPQRMRKAFSLLSMIFSTV